MNTIPVQEILEGKLPKGTMIVVRWIDASDARKTLQEHETSPEMICKDWGLYLGCSGHKKKFILLGKDVVELHNEWGATRIPIDLIEEVQILQPQSEIIPLIQEAKTLGRKISLRRHRRKEDTIRVQIN